MLKYITDLVPLSRSSMYLTLTNILQDWFLNGKETVIVSRVKQNLDTFVQVMLSLQPNPV